jgi:hypothetical protein
LGQVLLLQAGGFVAPLLHVLLHPGGLVDPFVQLLMHNPETSDWPAGHVIQVPGSVAPLLQ